MASLDEEIRLDEEENRRELAFIRTQLPSDVKKFYSDKDILYMMDRKTKWKSIWKKWPVTFVNGRRTRDSARHLIRRKSSSSFRLTWISRNRMHSKRIGGPSSGSPILFLSKV